MTTLYTLFATFTMQYGLPVGLIDSICWVESKHNPNAIHHDDGASDSIGLCQLKLATAQWMGYKGDAKGLLDPRVNVEYSAKYLKYQIKRYDNNAVKAVIAYNRGNAKSLTRTDYSDRVIRTWRGSQYVQR